MVVHRTKKYGSVGLVMLTQANWSQKESQCTVKSIALNGESLPVVKVAVNMPASVFCNISNNIVIKLII